jgi:hypothetical protein
LKAGSVGVEGIMKDLQIKRVPLEKISALVAKAELRDSKLASVPPNGKAPTVRPHAAKSAKKKSRPQK